VIGWFARDGLFYLLLVARRRAILDLEKRDFGDFQCLLDVRDILLYRTTRKK
jgi:hypothetical protein